MNKNTVLKQIEEKLSPAVKNVENGNASEHDIFPSLLWLLLENSKDLERSAGITKGELLERIDNLKQVSAAEIEALLANSLSQLLESNAGIEKSVTATESNLLERIGNLKQVLQEDVKTVVAQENQKTHSLLKWLLVFCIVQFIGLGALAAVILMR
jgi:predicted Zn-dependent peptidase